MTLQNKTIAIPLKNQYGRQVDENESPSFDHDDDNNDNDGKLVAATAAAAADTTAVGPEYGDELTALEFILAHFKRNNDQVRSFLSLSLSFCSS
jgi:hypothetical protein